MKSYTNKTINDVFIDTVLSKPENIQKEMIKIFTNIYESVNCEYNINIYELLMKSKMKLQ